MPQDLYETTYCGRGKDELYIREFKEAVNGDRLSCHSFNANRLRIFLHAASYILMHSIREQGLEGTALEKSTLLEIREKVLLTAVNIRILKKASCLTLESITQWNGASASASFLREICIGKPQDWLGAKERQGTTLLATIVYLH